MLTPIKFKPLISLILAVILIFSGIIMIGKVLIPFIIALILAYILNPLLEKIQNKIKIKRSIICFIAALIVAIMIFSLPLYLLPSLALQLKTVINKIPDAINAINKNILDPLNIKYAVNFHIQLDQIKVLILSNMQGIFQKLDLLPLLARNGMLAIEALVYMILTPFILFYSLINWQYILKFFENLIPRPYLTNMLMIFKEIDLMLASYLRGQILVMFIMAVYYAMALHFVGLSSGIVIGILTGLLVFIPYLGILTGFILALLISLAQFNDMHEIIAVLVVFGIGHVLEGALVTPFLVGGRIGLNPIMIILSLMVFGQLFGIVGVLLALPLSTISVVLIKHIKLYYMKSSYYGEQK